MSQQLTILGSSLTALAVARDAHALGLNPLIMDTARGIACHTRRARRLVLSSQLSPRELTQRLIEATTQRDYLVASSDQWVKYVVAERSALEKAFRVILHPANSALEICLDKARFAAWCAANEISAPRAWLAGVQPRPAQLNPPFLIRPASTLHSAGAVKLPKATEARSESELEAWLQTFAEQGCPAIVSESLLHQPLTQFSVPFARSRGGLQLFVARKLRPAAEHCAVGSYVELEPQPEVEQLVRRAVEALDYFGIGEAEVLRSESTGRLDLIEINARPWLQYALAPASGHDFLGTLVGTPRAMRPLQVGRRWINLGSDLYVAFSSSIGSVRRGQLGLGSYLLSLLRANVYARFDVLDPVPAFRRIDN
jgi:predicted ATP-grasp superfamily ATP-dependent carboligase